MKTNASNLFSKKALVNMAKSFNTRGGAATRIKLTQNKKELFTDLRRGLSADIPVKKCIIKKLKNINTDDYFKVSGPVSRGEWLNTINIDAIMTQYEESNNNFNYLGTFPIDFKKMYPEVFETTIKTKHKYAAIFNTDPSNKPGQHWIALVIDGVAKSICFFDSNGTNPPKEITAFINKINKKLRYHVFINTKVHQTGDGSCGLYAINFIVSRLKGISCEQYFNCIASDRFIEKTRKKLFH